MSEDFEFFITEFNNWNFNNMIHKPGFDPLKNNKKLDPFGYNLYKIIKNWNLSDIIYINIIVLLC
jgi:hypothetical protein